MKSLTGKLVLSALCIGLIVILTLAFTGYRPGKAEGNPHEIWALSDTFSTLEQAVEFLNYRHIHDFQIVRDENGNLRIVYEY